MENNDLIGLMKRNNDLLETLLLSKSNLKRRWYPLDFQMTIPIGSTWNSLGKKTFPFNFLCDSIGLVNQTNKLAVFKVRINKENFFQESFVLGASGKFVQNDGMLVPDTWIEILPFKRFIKRPFELEIEGYSSHSGTQLTLFAIFGWIITDLERDKINKLDTFKIGK